MKLKVEIEREKDGRWIAEINELPGCMTYGKTRNDALDKVKALALKGSSDFLMGDPEGGKEKGV